MRRLARSVPSRLRGGATAATVVILAAACTDPMAVRDRHPASPLASVGLPPGVADTAATAAAHRAAIIAGPNRGATQVLTVGTLSEESVAAGSPVVSLPMESPWGATVDGRGLGVVTNLYRSAVTFVDVPNAQALGEVAVNQFPTSVAFSPDLRTVYVGTQGRTVDVIDAASRTRRAQFVVPGDPFTVAPSPDGTRLYAGMNWGGLYLLDAATGAILASTSLGDAVNGLAVNRSGTRVYATNYYVGTLFELDANTLAVLRSWPIGGIVQAVAVSPNGNRAMVANEGGFVTDVDLRSGLYDNYRTSTGPAFGLVPNASWQGVGATLTYSGNIQVYGLLTRSLRTPFPLGNDIRRGGHDLSSRRFMLTGFSYGLGQVFFFRS